MGVSSPAAQPSMRLRGQAEQAGLEVDVVLKEDQRSGRVTRGVVQDILTRSPDHPHGIKVRLTSGLVGRVKRIVGPEPEA